VAAILQAIPSPIEEMRATGWTQLNASCVSSALSHGITQPRGSQRRNQID
jgi:hypothetical protein